MNKAKEKKNDEFYTRLPDIEKELYHYREQLKGKTIFMNCDDPLESNFWQYFFLNFDFLGLKKIISTHYDPEEPTYKLEYDGSEVIRTDLEQNGDFRSPEAIEILKESDVVITNPPFSLYREYVAQLMEYEKDFLIIGNFNSVTYKEIFPLIKDGLLWMGYGNVKEFIQPDGSIKKFGNISWFTNLDVSKRHEKMILFRKYNEEDYPTYDNYNAINVDRVSDIPMDYDGVMGVPITFLTKYNPKQFEIIGSDFQVKDGLIDEIIKRDWDGKLDRGYVNGVRKYSRLLIRNKHPEIDTEVD